VVRGNLLALEAEGVGGEMFNMACGSSMSLNDIVEHLRRLLGCEGDIAYGPPRAGDVPMSLADIGRARERLGYEPEISVEEGLEKVVAWFKEQVGG